ncbi:hypothetical protein ACFFQF_30315 [Haladaptatus pallidirubidus]|uniref:hypothetical protein n=1 Tax=Haladaptatus pallidirubidus TaxID=1008152 RepID=UPI0035E75A49
MPEVDLIGISEQTVDQARTQANAIGTSAWSHRELLQAADGVVICSTTAAHDELIELALQHNVAILQRNRSQRHLQKQTQYRTDVTKATLSWEWQCRFVIATRCSNSKSDTKPEQLANSSPSRESTAVGCRGMVC